MSPTVSQGAPMDPSGAAESLPRVQRLLPDTGMTPLDAILGELALAPLCLPFGEERMSFVVDAARSLSKIGRGMPETQALAFWMRKAEIIRLAESFAGLQSDEVLLMPRGTVFHIPPANVDTLFVYSWVLSILVGNRNIVRLSSRATSQANLIVSTLNSVLASHPGVKATTSMIAYGHDESITRTISASCDVRVIWGGDATVQAVRSVPLPPHATELTFPDRFSMAAISVSSYSALSPPERDRLAEDFFNDAYWFDQLGCSSARLIVWVGVEDASRYADDFHSRVRTVIRDKAYTVDTSIAISKVAQAYGTMIDAEVTGYSFYDNSMTVLDVAAFPDDRGSFCGAGFFYQLQVSDLSDITGDIRREDQTLSAFGFSPDSLRDFAVALLGRGIDRIVPFGQALQFNRIWDGHDLLQAFTRRVTITKSSRVVGQ